MEVNYLGISARGSFRRDKAAPLKCSSIILTMGTALAVRSSRIHLELTAPLTAALTLDSFGDFLCELGEPGPLVRLRGLLFCRSVRGGRHPRPVQTGGAGLTQPGHQLCKVRSGHSLRPVQTGVVCLTQPGHQLCDRSGQVRSQSPARPDWRSGTYPAGTPAL